MDAADAAQCDQRRSVRGRAGCGAIFSYLKHFDSIKSISQVGTMPAGRLGDGIEVGDRPRDDRGQGVIARFLKSLTQQRERPFRGGRNGVIQINAAARLSPKEFAQ
jgi:hypothetical protein